MLNQVTTTDVDHFTHANDDDLAAVVEDLRCKLETVAQQLTTPRKASVNAQYVEAVLAARRDRDRFFDQDLFADPAWDMLLELYALELRQQRISVSKLCVAAAVPATTALRWLGKLEQDGLVRRDDDHFDGRRWWVGLTSKGSEAMRRYFESCPAVSII